MNTANDLRIPLPAELVSYQEDLELFFTGMVSKLFDNRSKGKWEKIDVAIALKQMGDEIDELQDCLMSGDLDGAYDEAVDVANFALIVASMFVSGRPNPFAPAVKTGQALDFLKWASKQDVEYCILWPFRSKTGPQREYGSLGKNQSEFGRRAHRVTCGMAHGKPPTPDHEAAHLCGNSLCVNPNHVKWATSAENQMHKLEHGTLVTPVSLSWEEADMIRDRRKQGASVKSLTEEMKVSRTSIYKVLQGVTYAPHKRNLGNDNT